VGPAIDKAAQARQAHHGQWLAEQASGASALHFTSRHQTQNSSKLTKRGAKALLSRPETQDNTASHDTMASLKRSFESDPLASNISSKVYVRSTKSGKVQKIVREVYLRQDIPCSSQLCNTCSAPKDASGKCKLLCLVLSRISG